MNNKILLNTIEGKRTRTPIWLMRQAGRYLPEYREIRKKANNFLDFCYNHDLAVEATLQPIRKFNFDASILFSDILVIPDSLGVKVEFKENEGPQLVTLNRKEDLIKLNKINFLDKLSPVFSIIKTLKKELPSDVSLIGFSGSPWTLSCYMIEGRGSKDFKNTRQKAYFDPDFFSELMDILVHSITEYLKEQINSGVDVIQLFDSWSGVLPKEQFYKWVILPNQKIVDSIRKFSPKTKIICFPREACSNLSDFANIVKPDVISIDTKTPLSYAKKMCGNILLQGNLDPISLLGDKNTLKKEIDNIFEQMRGSNFIFNLGHGILPDTPVENVEFLVKYVKEYKL